MQVKIKNLSYCISEKYLLKNISCTFEPGKLYGLIGPNGSGKSTLLKCLVGLWNASEGCVVWQGQDMSLLDRQMMSQTVSLVPQNHQELTFDYTVYDLVAMGLYSYVRLDHREFHRKVERALQIVDAWQFAQAKITELSGGEQQRVWIARALVTQAPILLLDEPISSLDIKHQLDIMQVLRELKTEGKVLVIALHDLNIANKFCDELCVLNKGVLDSFGPCSDVLNSETLQRVFEISPNDYLNSFAR